MSIKSKALPYNRTMVKKLCVVVLGMFGFGYALVPMYRAICTYSGINVLALSELDNPGQAAVVPKNTQIDVSRTITVEFDANTPTSSGSGIWQFKPAVSTLKVHPGELNTVMYEFQNTQNRRITAQAIPSYAPQQAMNFFNKVECFCFRQYTLEPGEKKEWPVAFVIDPKLSKDVTSITLSYTFFEVGGGVAGAGSKV